MGEMINAYKILVGRHEARSDLGGQGLETNIILKHILRTIHIIHIYCIRLGSWNNRT
jgi:hypothetical protein